MNSDNTGTTTIILLGHLSVVRSSMLLVPPRITLAELVS